MRPEPRQRPQRLLTFSIVKNKKYQIIVLSVKSPRLRRAHASLVSLHSCRLRQLSVAEDSAVSCDAGCSRLSRISVLPTSAALPVINDRFQPQLSGMSYTYLFVDFRICLSKIMFKCLKNKNRIN